MSDVTIYCRPYTCAYLVYDDLGATVHAIDLIAEGHAEFITAG